ncbi:hypothetical protein AALP_AAs71535U000200 [Arabis alpina]|uniref:Uncharacterized protein n=1 Tax=Arabis alpina TaxID=50452 RepID=A0A087FZC1_ARAAL|nr:hypothetical protein AALP_AAs71535U000200 [Arabis alpina]
MPERTFGVRPTDTTKACVLSAISQTDFLEIGSLVKVLFPPEIDVFIRTGLVDMNLNCGYLNNGISVFQLMKVEDVLTWISMASSQQKRKQNTESSKPNG